MKRSQDSFPPLLQTDRHVSSSSPWFLQDKIDVLYTAENRIHLFYQKTSPFAIITCQRPGLFHELFMSRSNLCNLVIFSLTSFLVNRSRKKTQTSPLSLYKAFFQRYSLYRVNTDWLCPETHTVPAKRHCHKSSPSFLS